MQFIILFVSNIYLLILYCFLRSYIYDLLRSLQSDTFIKKYIKGFWNRLWYIKINEMNDLGVFYNVNIIMSIVSWFSFLSCILLGWIPAIQFLPKYITILAFAIGTPLNIYSELIHNKNMYSSYFILSKKCRHSSGNDSSILDIITLVIIPLVIIFRIVST